MNGHRPARRIEAAYDSTIEGRTKPDDALSRHGETIRMRCALTFDWQRIPSANNSGRRIQSGDLAAVVERKPELPVLVELEMLWTRAVAITVAIRGGEREGLETL